MKLIGIYKLTNTLNNKIYIGKSVDIKRRLSRHKHSEKKLNEKSLLSRAIKKYGWDNFHVEILEEFDNAIGLLEKEASWIRKLNSTDRKIGYNICEYSSDFTGCKHTEETKRKLSEINKGKHKGEKNYMFGRTHTPEAKAKISEANKKNIGKKNPFFGKKHTKESMIKMVETKRRNNGYKKRKPVIQLDPITENIIKVWDSAEEAAIQLFNDARKKVNIRSCCQGQPNQQTSMGFKWRYKI